MSVESSLPIFFNRKICLCYLITVDSDIFSSSYGNNLLSHVSHSVFAHFLFFLHPSICKVLKNYLEYEEWTSQIIKIV